MLYKDRYEIQQPLTIYMQVSSFDLIKLLQELSDENQNMIYSTENTRLRGCL